MTGQFSERPGVNQLHEMVYGPGTRQDKEQSEAELAQQQFADGMKIFTAAYDRGDMVALEDAEGRLNELLEAHPELRQKFESED